MNKIIIASLLTIPFIIGCGGDSSRPTDLPPLFPCVVTITQDGQPLDGATVSFASADTSAGAKYQATAITDDTGKAVATTYGFDGVPAGKYKVCVWKTLTEPGKQIRDGYGDLVDAPGTEYRTVDPKYSFADSTPHEIEIVGKGTPPASFDVGKPVKIKK